MFLVSFACIAAGWMVLAGAGIVHQQQQEDDTTTKSTPHLVKNGITLPSTSPVATKMVGDVVDSHSPRCVALPPHPNVSTILENFYLCYDDVTCSGTLRFDFIDRSICTKKRRSLSANSSLSSFLTDVIGPDLFRFRLEGPETLTKMVGASTVPVDELVAMWHSMSPFAASKAGRVAPCSYAVVIPELRFRGTYRVGLEWLYRDYAAMDELSGHWPPLLKQSLLEVDPLFSTNYHLQQCTLPSTTTVTCKKETSLPGVSTTFEQSPICNGLERDTTGRWVVEPELAGSPVYTRVRVKKIQRSPIIFQWALQPEIARQWLPNACSMILVVSALLM
ncbi:GPI-anchored surface protein, putative [Bodo saltans]|uniref:GPI-anchored surface protein, putative n=1 Tax=Bodo saltans TaxID=75058 RepID=A0A0S4JKM5_BODSA|nr:GPI-anchored surface protein, putative [Bodo saltans]|eukprot:CUG91135.1 GPI-anchored surface protein, putative [Bodo saltans]